MNRLYWNNNNTVNVWINKLIKFVIINYFYRYFKKYNYVLNRNLIKISSQNNGVLTDKIKKTIKNKNLVKQE